MEGDLAWPDKMYVLNVESWDTRLENAPDISHPPPSHNINKGFLLYVLKGPNLPRSESKIRNNLKHGLAFNQPYYVKLS